MSLTNISGPQYISTVNNTIPIVFSGSSSGTYGYLYQLKIYDNTDFLNPDLIVSLIIYPDVSNTNYMIYDLKRVLRDYLSSDITDNWDTTTLISNPNSYKKYKYVITDWIGDVSGSTYDSGTLLSFRGVVQYGDTWSYSDYLPINSGSTGKWLTNTTEMSYKSTDYATSNMFFGLFDEITTWNALYIKTYTTNGIQAYYMSGITYSNNIPNILTCPIGPKNLNNAAALGLVYGSTGSTIIDDTVSYYEVDVRNTSNLNISLSNKLTITNNKNCYRYDGIEFLWLGELGSYETFTFRLKDIKTFDISREVYKKYINSLISNEWTYNIGDRGYDIYHITSVEKHVAYSDWINDNTIDEKLVELYSSPQVFIIKDDLIYPIIIESSNITQMNKSNDKTWRHNIVYTMAYDKNINL